LGFNVGEEGNYGVKRRKNARDTRTKKKVLQHLKSKFGAFLGAGKRKN